MSEYPGLEITEEQYERNRPPGLEVSAHQQERWQNGTPQSQAQRSSVTKLTPFPSSKTGKRTRKERKRGPIVIAAFILAAIIVSGAAVGGGLGASLSNCQNDLSRYQSATPAPSQQSLLSACPSSTTIQSTPGITNSRDTTTSPTSFSTTSGGLLVDYTVAPSTEIWDLAVDCAALSSTFQTSLYGDKFSVYCRRDWGYGSRKDAANNEVIVGDVMNVIAYSMADCLQACSVYTAVSRTAGIDSSCSSVVWINDMAHYNHFHGNCLLKNTTVSFGSGDSACGWCFSANKVP
ncbi:hypothetical protein ANO14919_103910 [Xylariales sp. No.14919]|nr:hypothetical protein F5X98DRAFT_378249 [Xylaria grammica]GAW20879.1 hypothetical protein ANO14919_103910 [Xylariales sp. No.14919]